jgi:hypothetical protein
MAHAEDHINELLKQPRENRARAAELLIDSLDEEPADADGEKLRAAELTRRARAALDLRWRPAGSCRGSS